MVLLRKRKKWMHNSAGNELLEDFKEIGFNSNPGYGKLGRADRHVRICRKKGQLSDYDQTSYHLTRGSQTTEI